MAYKKYRRFVDMPKDIPAAIPVTFTAKIEDIDELISEVQETIKYNSKTSEELEELLESAIKKQAYITAEKISDAYGHVRTAYSDLQISLDILQTGKRKLESDSQSRGR
jgi:glutamyl-tRNA reductase